MQPQKIFGKQSYPGKFPGYNQKKIIGYGSIQVKHMLVNWLLPRTTILFLSIFFHWQIAQPVKVQDKFSQKTKNLKEVKNLKH